ncbi:Ubiquitin carboxyl-terminal hydrolase 6 [Curvularia clavata]|uniref:Ubiquitin carboxyl-terminal hydrolase n=1 Tax=Curvularia clavata TaxID=95742 RepID=A0A9Q9DWQ6_CURCL|nr:Ubiquitin carboxyl-terminal hydrolase 6 [Curvularia clavata]
MASIPGMQQEKGISEAFELTCVVIVKHQGKKHEVEVDTTSNGETFKYQLFSITGVEPERQKVIVKGGQLKDDADMSKLGLKPGQTLMMMGTPSGSGMVIEKPKVPTKFLEDMDEAEAAQLEGATPAGLQNLGNTCYMNSTLQTLRSIPELQEELLRYSASNDAGSSSSAQQLSQFGLGGLGASSDLTSSLRDLFKQMSETQQGFPPLMFLNALRTAFPQFAQKAKDGHGYAQQDAEEAWSQIVSQLRQKLKVSDKDASGADKQSMSWIDKYMSGRFESVMECDEPAAKEAGEEPVHSEDLFFKLNCHINIETNHLRDGLAAGLKEKIEKRSEVLGRNAMYTKTSKIARLPKHLPVHFVRFDWRRDTNKKAKIMRKVTFPEELDALEFCTDELRKVLVPIRDKIRDVRKEEEDLERARKRQKRMRAGEENDTDPLASKEPLQKKKEAAQKKEDASKSEDTKMEEVEYKTDAQVEAERIASIVAAKKELLALVDPKMAADDGANQTGLYELRGVITHQGASADSGHYTSFVKKQGAKDPVTGKRKEEDGKWWWFNDEKVSEVDAERIQTLSGGGQSHSALILLYRAIPLPVVDEDVQMDEA